MAKQQEKRITSYYTDIIAMTIPLFLMAFFYYGPKTLLLALIAIITAKLADRFAAWFRSKKYNKEDHSSVAFALLIVLMVPVTVRFRVVVVAVLVAVLVVKEAFGGFGSYLFHPSAVGFCVAAVSWPDEIFRYPQPENWLFNLPSTWEQLYTMWSFQDVTLVEGPSYVLKNGGLPTIDAWGLLLGEYAGPLGVTCCLVIVSCAVYLVVKKQLPLATPVVFLFTIALIAFFFPRYTEITWQTWPLDYLDRLNVVKYELLSGAIVFSAVFLLDEPITLPKNTLSRIVYGLILGVAVMMFRYFGTYELGTCFALILVNAISGYFDRGLQSLFTKRKEPVQL